MLAFPTNKSTSHYISDSQPQENSMLCPRPELSSLAAMEEKESYV